MLDCVLLTSVEYLVRAYFNSKEFKFEIGEVERTIQRRTLMRLLPVLGDSEPSREDQEGEIQD